MIKLTMITSDVEWSLKLSSEVIRPAAVNGKCEDDFEITD